MSHNCFSLVAVFLHLKTVRISKCAYPGLTKPSRQNRAQSRSGVPHLCSPVPQFYLQRYHVPKTTHGLGLTIQIRSFRLYWFPACVFSSCMMSRCANPCTCIDQSRCLLSFSYRPILLMKVLKALDRSLWNGDLQGSLLGQYLPSC